MMNPGIDVEEKGKSDSEKERLRRLIGCEYSSSQSARVSGGFEPEPEPAQALLGLGAVICVRLLVLADRDYQFRTGPPLL